MTIVRCSVGLVALGIAGLGCGDDSSSTSSGSGGAGATGATSATSSASASTSTETTASGSTSDATSGAGAGSSSASTTSAGSASTGGVGGGGSIGCDACGEPSVPGVVANGDVSELSGLAASRLHDGVLYAHNDSGDDARFFAMTLAGEDRGTFNVTNAAARDWEEMSAGPCSDGSSACLYFADFGDNDEVRNDLVLYRVHEPADVGAGLEQDIEAESFPFSYPDGPHNAEAFVVHPTTGVVTIFTKAVTSRVFELVPPLEPRMVAVARGEIAFDSFVSLATSADLDPSGRTLAIRTYADVLLFAVPPGGSAVDALAAPSCAAPRAAENQGEAIAWLMSGTSYVTISEGKASELHLVGCP